MKTILILSTLLYASQALAVPAPIVVAGTVADEASKASLLARLREVFGAERVVDQLAVGMVSAPADWQAYVNKLVGPNLKLIKRGQLSIDGNLVSMRGDVASDAERLQIGADTAASLNPTYTVTNALRVSAPGAPVLPPELASRTVEFEPGKATLTEAGKVLLDEVSVVLSKLKGKKVLVIGHTDNAGSRASNQLLSQARAETVKLYVAGKGVDPDTVSVAGEGPDRPLADNRSAEGRARNRRIEFQFAR